MFKKMIISLCLPTNLMKTYFKEIKQLQTFEFLTLNYKSGKNVKSEAFLMMIVKIPRAMLHRD